MFHKNRNSWELVLRILDATCSKVGPTLILYETHLSHPLLTKYIRYLTSLGLIEEIIADRSKTYFITEKGDKLLSRLKSVKRVLV